MALKTRRPTGAVPWPLILIEGAEKSGKTWACAVLTASDKVGQCYWVDLGEGAADEYGAIPGVDYLIVEHDGSWRALYAAIEEIRDIAEKALANGEKPVVLVVDTMTGEWDLLKDWVSNRAMGSRSNRRKLEQDPNAEIVISQNYWNDANARHRKLMNLLKRFPGIVLMTAHGKLVTAVGEDGQPIENKKVYKVEGQKTLGADASCWIRLSREEPPIVVGLRSVHAGVRPGRDDPKPLAEDWTLECLIFDALKCDPKTAHVRDLVEGKPERTPEQIRDEAVNPGTSFQRLGEIYKETGQLGYDAVVVPNEHGQEELLPDLVRRLGNERKAQGQPSELQHKTMHALWRQAGDYDDREERLRFTSEIVGRPLESSKQLTAAEADQVITRLNAYIKKNTPPDDAAAGEDAV